jgi:hypothetical protein
MSAFPLAMSFLYHKAPGGSTSANVVGCAVAGGEIRRSVGMGGDPVSVTIDADTIPIDWDLETGEFTIQFGYDSDYVLLGGYRAARIVYHHMGIRSSSETPRPLLVTLLLVTLPGMLRDGKSPLLRESVVGGAYNPMLPDGSPDTGDSAYRTYQALADLCLDAIGIAHAAAPSAMNTAIDGATVMLPPPALDWGNAVAIAELEGLLARIGWTARMNLDGDTLSLVRLLRGGEPIVVPGGIAAVAEPYVLAPQRGVRSATIVVTSGSTRSIIIEEFFGQTTAEGEDPVDELEWVAFDERTGLWLNKADWESNYPGEIAPGDIDAFKEGPPADPEEAKRYAAIFSALRITNATLRRKASAFVSVPQDGGGWDIGAGETSDAPLAGSVGYVVIHGAVRRANQYVNWPEDDQPTRIDGCRWVADAGVVVLPADLVYVRIGSGSTVAGIAAAASAIDFANVRLVFAHESREGDSAIDFYTSVWQVTNTAGVLSVSRVTDAGAIAAAIAGRESMKVHDVSLQRVLGRNNTDADPSPLNDTELHDIAERFALARASDEAVEAGTIRIRGFHEITPGDWEGAVTSVAWSLGSGERGGATIVEVNGHETPASEFDAITRSANRSVGAGLGGYRLAGSWSARGDTRAAIAADLDKADGGGAGGAGGGEGLSAGARDRGTAARRSLATGSTAPGAGSATDRGSDAHAVQDVYAVITGYEELRPNVNEYDWEEVALNPGAASPWTKYPGVGRSSATMPKAVNMAELPNTLGGVQGIDVDLDTLAGGFSMKPVGRGGFTGGDGGGERVVLLRGPYGVGEDARMLIVAGGFHNAIDGQCEDVRLSTMWEWFEEEVEA